MHLPVFKMMRSAHRAGGDRSDASRHTSGCRHTGDAGGEVHFDDGSNRGDRPLRDAWMVPEQVPTNLELCGGTGRHISRWRTRKKRPTLLLRRRLPPEVRLQRRLLRQVIVCPCIISIRITGPYSATCQIWHAINNGWYTGFKVPDERHGYHAGRVEILSPLMPWRCGM